MDKTKLKEFIEKNKWLCVFLLAVPFFNETYPPISYLGDDLVDVLKLIAMAIMIFMLFRKKRKISLLFISLISIEAWWFISTLLNYSLSEILVYRKLLMDIVNALSMALIVECFLDDPKDLLYGLLLNFELSIYPDLVSVFLTPKGQLYFLLGYYSTASLWLLPALCVAFLNIAYNKEYIRSGLLIIACLLITIRTWCATIVVSVMGFLGVIVLWLLLRKIDFKGHKIKLFLSFFVILAIAANLFILFVYTGGSFPLIDAFIEKILRRNTSFTERTVIWKEAMRMISEKPIIGHGFRPEVHASNSAADVFIHSHNQLLQRLNATGVIGLITFIIFHILLIQKVDSSQDSFSRAAVIAAVFSVSITYMTEGYKKFFRFYLIFFLAYHVNAFVRKKLSDTANLLK